MNLASYLTILDSVQATLTQKDPKTINLFVTCAAGMSATNWMIYAMIKGDYFIFAPCFVGLQVFILNISLYIWTLGYIKDNNRLIRGIKRIFLKKATLKGYHIQKNDINLGEFSTKV